MSNVNENLFTPQNQVQSSHDLFSPISHLKLTGRWVTGENQLQLIRIVNDAVARLIGNRAYFREEEVVKGAMKIAQKEMKAEDIENDAFEIFVRFQVSQTPFVIIGDSGFITTPEMSEREREMLALAGEENGVHMLPVHIVSEAVDKKRAALINGHGLSDANMSKLIDAIRFNLAELEKMGSSPQKDLIDSIPKDPASKDPNQKNASDFIEALKSVIQENIPKEEGAIGLSAPQTQSVISLLKTFKKSSKDLVLTENQFKSVKDVIDRSRQGPGISDEQEKAVLAGTRSPRRVTVIEGTAGAGKTYTTEAIKDAYVACGYQVIGTALSWNAAKVLESAAGLDNSVATEGLVNQMLEARAAGTDYFRKPTLLIVDEAGMLGTRHMFHLLDESQRSKNPVKVILTGDSLQLSPVDAGNALQAIVEFHGTTRINEIRRQKQESHRQAVYSFSERYAGQGLYTYMHQEAVTWCKKKSSLIDMVVRDYISYRHAFPGKSALVLALSNEDVRQINQRIRQAHKKAGLIEAKEIKVKVTDGRDVWEAGFSVGDEIVMRGNDKNMIVYDIDENQSLDNEEDWFQTRIGAFNRNAGVIRAIRRSSKFPGSYDIIIDLHGERPGRVVLNTQKFRHSSRPGFPVTHNFATTIYASQGQTVHQVFLIDSPRIDFRLAYVGMSRHKEGVQIYFNETEIHERLNNVRGESTPLKQRVTQERTGKMEEMPVKLGQYNRSEMSQAVARSWSKNSMNLTAMMFEREKRGVVEKKAEPKPEELARLQPRSADESAIIDFDPETSRPYPLIDMQKLLSLPDPVEEHELIGPTEVEEINRAKKGTEMLLENQNPLRKRQETTLPSLKPAQQNNLFSKVKDWWGGAGVQEDLTLSIPENTDGPSPLESEDQEKNREESTLKKFFKLAVRSKIEMPFLPVEKPQGLVNGETFTFENVKQTPGSTNPSDEFLSSIKGRFWTLGKWGEPRILARNGIGQIVARYRLDGRCVVGEGFPPMMLNPKASAKTSIMIVPGPKEWLLTQSHMNDRHKDNPDKIPHLIWAAHDADWGWVVPAMVSTGKPVVIARSKNDPQQLEWAIALRNQLSKHKVSCCIVPEPEPTPNQIRPGLKP